MVMLFLILSASVCLVKTLEMPSYLKACRENDPELNKCALKNGNEAIPFLIKGDRKYRIPNMMPLKIPKIEVEGANNFKIKMENLDIWGLDKSKLVDIDINVQKKTIKLIIETNLLDIKATYEIDAKLLVLPLKGTGPAHVTLHKPVLTYFQEWSVRKNNDDYYGYIKNSTLTYDVGKVVYNFENLFNGNELLGTESNKVLNENWADVHADLSKPVGDTILLVINQILSNVYELIPYKYLFIHD